MKADRHDRHPEVTLTAADRDVQGFLRAWSLGRVAELPFLGGLSVDETADALGISSATVDREWQVARAWLYTRLTETPRA
jgi:ECF sigma factor